jgi:hypothetical protein
MLPKWMEKDMLYGFKMENLKKDVKNKLIPYKEIIDLKHYIKVELIESKTASVRISRGRHLKRESKYYKELNKRNQKPEPVEDEGCTVFYFENMIEAYKFYSYSKALIKNQHEFYNSLKYKIHYNLGKNKKMSGF